MLYRSRNECLMSITEAKSWNDAINNVFYIQGICIDTIWEDWLMRMCLVVEKSPFIVARKRFANKKVCN